MVYRPIDKSKAMKKRASIVFAILITAIVLVFAGFILMRGKLFSENDEGVLEEESQSSEIEPEKEIESVDLQAIVDDWANSVNGNRSVLIYDLDKGELVGSYNPDEVYNTASLYKLFVVYEGYRRVESGTWLEDEYIGSTGQTILECLDLAIRESNSPCAEALWAMIGHNELDQIIEDEYKITDSDISNLTSNASDILKIMQLFYQHPEINDENLVGQMMDSFLNQPVTTYDWRQGLPSGFNEARVYNKVGWDYNPDGYWNIYHDAAIVEFPEENRHFIVVVMTNRVSFMKIRELGSMIENEFLTQYYN